MRSAQKKGQAKAEFAEHVGLAVKTYGNYEQQRREWPERSCRERKRPALKAKGGPSFLSKIRAECQHDRESNFSRQARVTLSNRDKAFAAATVHASIDMMAHRPGIPSVMDRETAAILLVVSVALSRQKIFVQKLSRRHTIGSEILRKARNI